MSVNNNSKCCENINGIQLVTLEVSKVSQEPPGVKVLMQTKNGMEWRRFHCLMARFDTNRRTSIILAGFSMSVLTSLQVSAPTHCPGWIYTLLAVNTVVMTSLHVFALIISTCLLPRLEVLAEEYVAPLNSDTMMSPVPCNFSPHERFHGLLAITYNLSHVLGLFLFLLQMVLLNWVKFWDFTIIACWAGSTVMVPFMIAFAFFCWHFHRMLNTHLYETRTKHIDDIAEEFCCSKKTTLELTKNFNLSCNNSRRNTVTSNSMEGIDNKGFVSQENVDESVSNSMETYLNISNKVKV